AAGCTAQCGQTSGSSARVHAKGQPATTAMSGNRRASARTAVDFAVPLWPRISTPPITGLMAFSSSASLIDSCPAMAVNGNTARVRMTVLRGVEWYLPPLPFETGLRSLLFARALWDDGEAA